MATNASRRARERRIRAQYRKKVWMVGILTLIVGVVVGYVLCTLTTPKDNVASSPANLATTTATVEAYATDAPMADATAIVDVQAQETVAAEPTATSEPAATVNIINEAGEPAGNAVSATAEPAPTENAAAATGDASGVAPLQLNATAEATAEPTATPEPTPEPAAPIIVPYGEARTFETQVKADGKARTSVDGETYETLSLTLQVTGYKNHDFYVSNYADSYALNGDEAAAEFTMTLNGYTGELELNPQNFLLMSFVGEDSSVITQGFKLIDAAIAGKSGVPLTNDKAVTYYKRFSYQASQGDMKYLAVNSYVNGETITYWFEVQDPNPTVDATATPEASESGDSLTIGSTGDAVKKLQQKLIEMKLLTGTPDGKFGNYTAEAVKTVQKQFGMEQTGIADAAFLEKLYSGN